MALRSNRVKQKLAAGEVACITTGFTHADDIDAFGPAGFDVAEDILAITVNRWPHGYAYEYLDLWDPDWAPGQAPHEIARQRVGNIAIANSDAGASAYTHVAIDEALRAIRDLSK